MTVYVDDMRASLGRMIMCHMIADTDEELFAMAEKIGVKKKWWQKPPKHDSHFDIALSKKGEALYHGAVSITWKECACMTFRRRVEGILGQPSEAVDWVLNHKATGGGPRVKYAAK